MFEHLEQNYVVYARKEIIISAGTVSSPQLLMLSGIGARQHLEKLGIPVVADLPVGQNLQDHITAGLFFTIGKEQTCLQRSPFTFQNLLSYFEQGRGPLTLPGAVEGLGFVKTKYANTSLDWPDAEIYIPDLSPSSDAGTGYRRAQGFSELLWRSVFEPYINYNSFTTYPTLLRPKSRGFIKLRSADYRDPPIINPRYLSDERDVQVLVEAMKVAIAVGLSPAYKQLDTKIFKTFYPGCEIYRIWSDEYLACVARVNTQTVYEPVGTCRMGAREDPRSVVDPELRVIGVAGLRVIDASVMPEIEPGTRTRPPP